MKPREDLTLRKEMVVMHDEYLSHLYEALENRFYMEASWLCYSIIEQRITRMIEKHISQCPKEKKIKGYPIAISTRIQCIQNLIRFRYGGYAALNAQLFEDILSWCDRRNDLVHGLVSLDHYKQYDSEFRNLAIDGTPLVEKLYQEASKIREWYYSENTLDPFPKFTCNCKKHKCIKE